MGVSVVEWLESPAGEYWSRTNHRVAGYDPTYVIGQMAYSHGVFAEVKEDGDTYWGDAWTVYFELFSRNAYGPQGPPPERV